MGGTYHQTRRLLDSFDFGEFNQLRDRSPNAFNSLAVLFPQFLYTQRDNLSGLSPLAQLPDLYFLNLRYLTPGEAYTIGSDIYRPFPFIEKTPTFDNSFYTSSGYYGYAVKVTP
jgi:hypothetical protein